MRAIVGVVALQSEGSITSVTPMSLCVMLILRFDISLFSMATALSATVMSSSVTIRGRGSSQLRDCGLAGKVSG